MHIRFFHTMCMVLKYIHWSRPYGTSYAGEKKLADFQFGGAVGDKIIMSENARWKTWTGANWFRGKIRNGPKEKVIRVD
jgi:hypothetical protein